jgi:serine phosphatase RsbU (regulator of sigma subunit)
VLPWFALVMFLAGLVLAGLAIGVALRRGSPAGISLSVLLVAVGWWGLAYAVELSVSDLAGKTQWGDLKYVGITTIAPAWLVFVLQYTGRRHLVTRRLVALLTVEPVAVLLILANPGTHDLVRYYPASAAGETLPVVGAGPVFWANLVYSNVLVLVATAVFVTTMARLSRRYRRMAAVLVAAALLPWVANLLYNFEVGPFARLDLTPFAFTVTGGALFWGLFRQRLVNLLPLARGLVVETMTDPVIVLDAFGRIADVNPAAAVLLRGSRSELVGQSLAGLLEPPSEAAATATSPTTAEPTQLVFGTDDDRRTYDVRRQPLPDRGGVAAGELVVLHDVTELVRASRDLEELLTERSRIAAALQASLVPGELPRLPFGELASVFRPAGDGSEIGGDFLDVFPLDHDAWGLLLGDVSGKGAEAAAITAMTRYTLRTLADARIPPSETLRDLNDRLLAATTPERHCTLVYAVARTCPAGVELTLCLAGHHPPLLTRTSGEVEPFGKLGTVLGLLEDPELHDSHCVLGAGETLCLFTDGLVEARRSGDMFEASGITAFLRRHAGRPVGELATGLASAARDFSGHELADDLAILVLRADPLAGGAPDHSGEAVPSAC